MTPNGDEVASERAKAALHAVADDCAADFLGDGEADALLRIAVLAVADQKDETGGRRAPSGVRCQEVRAFPENRWRV